MIESREQLLNAFRDKARCFIDQPSPMTGIDLDDAAVAFKRYVLTEMGDQTLASMLGGMSKLLRKMQVAEVAATVAQIEQRLAD